MNFRDYLNEEKKFGKRIMDFPVTGPNPVGRPVWTMGLGLLRFGGRA
jgi:hypothetical protein